MSTLAEQRKNAIKTHENKTSFIVNQLQEMANAMRKIGLIEGANELDTIISSIQYDLKTLKTSASVN